MGQNTPNKKADATDMPPTERLKTSVALHFFSLHCTRGTEILLASKTRCLISILMKTAQARRWEGTNGPWETRKQ